MADGNLGQANFGKSPGGKSLEWKCLSDFNVILKLGRNLVMKVRESEFACVMYHRIVDYLELEETHKNQYLP